MSEMLPLVGSWADIEFARIQAQLGKRPELPWSAPVRFAEFLSFVWVTPTERGLTSVNAVSLQSEPMDVAGAAMSAHRPPRFERVGPGTFQSCAETALTRLDSSWLTPSSRSECEEIPLPPSRIETPWSLRDRMMSRGLDTLVQRHRRLSRTRARRARARLCCATGDGCRFGYRRVIPCMHRSPRRRAGSFTASIVLNAS